MFEFTMQHKSIHIAKIPWKALEKRLGAQNNRPREHELQASLWRLWERTRVLRLGGGGALCICCVWGPGAASLFPGPLRANVGLPRAYGTCPMVAAARSHLDVNADVRSNGQRRRASPLAQSSRRSGGSRGRTHAAVTPTPSESQAHTYRMCTYTAHGQSVVGSTAGGARKKTYAPCG
jgi:hypothetical protein